MKCVVTEWVNANGMNKYRMFNPFCINSILQVYTRHLCLVHYYLMYLLVTFFIKEFFNDFSFE